GPEVPAAIPSVDMAVGGGGHPPAAALTEHGVPEAAEAGGHLIVAAEGGVAAVKAPGPGVAKILGVVGRAKALRHLGDGLVPRRAFHPHGDMGAASFQARSSFGSVMPYSPRPVAERDG